MSTPSERVRTLVREGKIDATEGERLLAALGANEREGRAWRATLERPFERLGGGHAALLALLVSALALAVTRTGVGFDGVFDMHYFETVSFGTALVDEVADWPVSALLFFAAAYAFRSPGRLLDFLGVTGLSRLPSVILAWPTVWLLLRHGHGHGTPDLAFVVSTALASTGIVAQVALLFHGFQNATGAKGTRLVLAFMAGAVASEVVSKVLVLFVLSRGS